MQTSIKDRRLNFGDKGKSQMKIDSDPLQVADAHYAKPADVNMIEVDEVLHYKGPMIETSEGFKQGIEINKATEGLRVRLQKIGITNGLNMQVNMVELGEDVNMGAHEESIQQSEDQVKVAYPNEDGSLIGFLHRCQRNKSEVILCPRCSSVFEKKTIENIEKVRISRHKGNWKDALNQYVFDKWGIPRR